MTYFVQLLSIYQQLHFYIYEKNAKKLTGNVDNIFMRSEYVL